MPGMNASVFGALATDTGIGIAYAENGTSGDAIYIVAKERNAAGNSVGRFGRDRV
jgi:hypothetical protein